MLLFSEMYTATVTIRFPFGLVHSAIHISPIPVDIAVDTSDDRPLI